MNQGTQRTVEMLSLRHPCLILALFLPAAVLSVGCGSSSGSTSDGPSRYMTAYVDPDFAGRSYDTISVYLISDALDERKELEEELTGEFHDVGIVAWQSGTIISPTRSWDSTQIVDRLRASGVDGLLRIRETDTWVVSSWIPETEESTVTTKEKIEIEEDGKLSRKNEGEKKTTTTIRTEKSGGYMKESEQRRFHVELIDIESGRVAWAGSIVVKGSNFSWLADRVARQLRRDGMVIRKEISPDA